MLMGEYEHTLDAKGRLIMPAKLRQDIGEKFVITKGLDGCLFAFSQEEWLNFETKLKSLPLSDRNARNFVRFFLSGATECEIDKQGRFLIPNNLRLAAELDKEAVIIGVGTKLKMSISQSGEKNGMYGKTHSLDTKNTISMKQGRRVMAIDITTGDIVGEYQSMRVAEKVTGVAHEHISACCRNKQRTAGGYKWQYI